jgi:hypothetical protein
MTIEAGPMTDACVVSGMDDIDMTAMRMRMDLLLHEARGAVPDGDGGMDGGFRLRSPETGLSAMVTLHDGWLNLWAHHSGPVKASSRIQFPADAELLAGIREGESGIRLLVDQWTRAIGDDPRSHNDTAPDPMISDLLARIADLVCAIVSIENRHYPTWNTIRIEMPTWMGGGRITSGGRQFLTAEARSAVMAVLPRIVDLGRTTTDRGHMITPYAMEFKFTPHDGISIMRTLSNHAIALPTRILLKAGMEGHP